MRQQMQLKRIAAFASAVLIAACGLTVRHNAATFAPFFRNYAPDSLWALMILCLAVTLWPRRSLRVTIAISLGFCILIECSQLLQPPILVTLRATRIGGLVLGRGFLWSDIVCYAVGVALGSLAAHYAGRFATRHSSARELALSRGNE
jgi:hypothetical protein